MSDATGMQVTTEIEDGIAVITIDDGGRNALTVDRLTQITEAIDACDTAAAIVLTGRPGAFTAGLDLKVLRDGTREDVAVLVAALGRLAIRIWTEPRPVIVAATGHSLAAGTVIALAADHAVAERGNYAWGLTETQVGLVLPRYVIALARANVRNDLLEDLLIPGKRLTPEDAVVAGLADHVASPDDVLPRARAKAAELAALPLLAYGGTKLRLRGAVARKLLDTLDADCAAVTENFTPPQAG